MAIDRFKLFNELFYIGQNRGLNQDYQDAFQCFNAANLLRQGEVEVIAVQNICDIAQPIHADTLILIVVKFQKKLTAALVELFDDEYASLLLAIKESDNA